METNSNLQMLQAMLRKQRKSKRETLELKELLAKARSHKSPDPKVIKMIGDAILEIENS